jgi:nuclear protein localization family protein 4
MIVRVRSRDGLERVKLSEDATVGDLQKVIEDLLSVPRGDQEISTDVNLLSGKQVECLQGETKRLQAYGIEHGSMLYLRYGFERNVPAATRKSCFEERPFGTSMTVGEMIAKQTRIERQENADCSSVSMERHAANQFQLYVNQSIAFSVKRCGFMYGTVDEEKNVKVQFIFEPSQDSTPDDILIHSSEEELLKVETIAGLLGLSRVGYIFSQSSKEKDYLISTKELIDMAGMQDKFGEAFVTAVVSLSQSEEGTDVHFEAYQCSRQCVKLNKEGWFDPEEEGKYTGVSTLKDPREPSKEKPVIVAGKDTSRVDNEWFLCPVKILDHEGLFSADFPVENRLTPQGTGELKAYLKQMAGKPFVVTLSDFHLLLFLAKHSNIDANDIALMVQAVGSQSDPGEGYKIIIESLAGV